MSAFSDSIKPTDEQQHNIDVVHTGVDTVIEAGAGCGKTAQLKMIATNERHRSGLCIYFNRAPAHEARRTFPANVSCQPPGAMVRVPVKILGVRGGRLTYDEVPIEDLSAGDSVLTYSNAHSGGFIRKKGSSIDVASREYFGDIINVNAGGQQSVYTADHHCVVWLNNAFDGKHVVYMMRRGDYYRVGRAAWRVTGRRMGLAQRVNDQQADAVWILSVHDSEEEAALAEALTQYECQMPGWLFCECGGGPPIEKLWSLIEPNHDQADICLRSFGRRIEYPLWDVGGTHMRLGSRSRVIRACNLIDGMRIPVPNGNFDDPVRNRLAHTETWPQISVERYHYDGLVHSLEVDRDHTYVADGIVTHNCSTAHSLAFHAMRGHPALERLDGDRVTAKMLAEDHLGIRNWFRTPPGRKDVSTWKIASLATQAVTRFCYSDADEIGLWHVPYTEGLDDATQLELKRVVLPFAQEIWADLQKPHGFAQFTPDHYMKMWALSEPVLEADFMMVDESQDTNGVLAGIVRRQDHLQRVFVGDAQQRLFSWRGTVDMMGEFPDAVRCKLTQSFRFGDAVAVEANRWLAYLDSDLRLRGLSSIKSRLDYIEQPDAILCRTNAATIEQAMNAQQDGYKVAVVGGTDEIASFAGAVDQLRQAGKTSHRDLAMFKTWEAVQEYVRDEKPGGSFATNVRLIERYGTSQVRAVAARCVDENDRDSDFVISTVHKVKGMEWPKVYLDPSLVPDDASDQQGDEISRGELMVGYVAVTRAQEVLDARSVEPFHQRRSRRRQLDAKMETA